MNPRAAFYARHGYLEIGRLPDLLVAGRDEILMRKTTSPWKNFNARQGAV